MTWQDITVFQFQQLTDLWQNAEGRDPFDLSADMVGICFKLAPQQVDSLSTNEFNAKCRELMFLSEVPEWKPVDYFETEGRRYRFVYDVRQIHAARYMEVKQYSNGGMVPNLHKMAASMIIPQQRRHFMGLRNGWQDAEYDAAKHEDYANDVLQAPIAAIHGSAVFFCKVLAGLMPALADFLTENLPETERKKALQTLQDSARFLDGSIPQPLSQSTSDLPSNKSTHYQPSNS